jgi:hypothetical protein
MSDQPTKRLYTALVSDPQTRDEIVFHVRAEDPASVREQIRQYYTEQDWGEPGRIHAIAFRSNRVQPMQIGHAYWEYQKLQEQVEQLCAKLLDAADGMEGNEGDTTGRDELYAYVASFEVGKKLIEAKYGDSHE